MRSTQVLCFGKARIMYCSGRTYLYLAVIEDEVKTDSYLAFSNEANYVKLRECLQRTQRDGTSAPRRGVLPLCVHSALCMTLTHLSYRPHQCLLSLEVQSDLDYPRQYASKKYVISFNEFSYAFRFTFLETSLVSVQQFVQKQLKLPDQLLYRQVHMQVSQNEFS